MQKNDLHDPQSDSFRDAVSTIDKKGNRVWIYPKKPGGPFYNKRTIVSWILLILLFSGPFIRIGGEPLLLINLLERKFVIFGKIFWPQDFYLFVIGMLTFIVFIVVFTISYGRLFCGWVCPQTIFMEMVFRKIEYWIEGDWKQQQRLNKSPWTRQKIIKKGLKHGIFYIISFLIANIFLAYIIGSEEVISIITDSPLNHLQGLALILLFTFVFYGVFAYMREQVCLVICPYGRLQGVLLDRSSLVVAYDYIRGENRAKFRKGEIRAEVGKGDCIDCGQCVHVCPTGIDIRNGTQLECINCTACIDACDFMMEKTGQEKGLIRYASEKGITTGSRFTFNARIIAYTVVLIGLLAVLAGLLVSRADVQTTILRTPGMSYQDQGNNKISNYTIQTGKLAG
jgi:cytochrome c oxidase accessory protein FixG